MCPRAAAEPAHRRGAQFISCPRYGHSLGQTRGVCIMADWKKLAISAFLADGVIDDAEVKVLKKELYADGVIDRQEVEFLIDLRTEAQRRAKGQPLHSGFENLFFKAITDNVLQDGEISGKEANWLRKML